MKVLRQSVKKTLISKLSNEKMNIPEICITVLILVLFFKYF